MEHVTLPAVNDYFKKSLLVGSGVSGEGGNVLDLKLIMVD